MSCFQNYIAILFLSISFYANAQLDKSMFDIRHISNSEGLSSQRVFSIVEDQSGAIWIATKTGIDRYNGREVKNYDLPGDFYYSDMAGRKLQLLISPQHGLWAYDHTGRIFNYSVQNDCFELMLSLDQFIDGEIILNKLCLDHNGILWMGLGKGLYKRDISGGVYPVVSGHYVNDIISTDESIFVSTSMGVFQLGHSQLSKENWLVKDKNAQTLFCDVANDRLWIGTFNNGLWVMDLSNNNLYPIEGLSSSFFNPIRDITKYNSQTILVGIDGGGVYAVDINSNNARLLISAEDSTDAFLRGNGVYAITKDRQGNIWIGSYSGGVSVAILSKYPITLMSHERGNVQSLANNNVNDIVENYNGDLWFATDGGISIRSVHSHRWSHYLSGIVIVSLCKGDGGYIWAGTYGDGVYLLNSQGQVIQHFTKQQGTLTTNYIFSIMQDIDGDLWIGGLDDTLLMMSKDRRQKQIYDIKWIHSLEIISKDLIAVATVNGFYIINKRTKDIEHYATSQEFHNQNTSAYIISMLFNDDGTVWLGTEGGGLNLYDMSTRNLKTFSTRDGLPSDDVYSLQRDSSGRLWVSTGKGIAFIEDFRVSNLNYLGDIDKEYNKSSFTHLNDGRFVYGSTDGVVFVTPNAISITSYQAPLQFTGIILEYSNINEENHLRPIVYEMLNKGAVQLDYNFNSFEITFESINYRFQRDIAYQYILDGYEKSWSSMSSNGMVRYTNVSPGSYLFKARSLRRSSGEIISEKSIIIKVSQPWWYSWWAWIFYVGIIGAIFYFILRYNSNRLQKKYNEDKVRYFIDTAHDIRTPVTLIMAPLEDLGKEKGLSDRSMYFLELARNNTQKLYSLISQLLEFEKVDVDKMRPILTQLNIKNILTEKVANFQPFCDKKQLQLNLLLPDEDIYVMADRYMVEMLLDNLISNACKYTMPQGSICLSLGYTKRKVIVEIKDTGIGIPKKDLKHIFSNVYRATNARDSKEDGTGFGLLQVQRIIKKLDGKIIVQSEENKGSTFTLTLKRVKVSSQYISKLDQTTKETLPVTDISDVTYEESKDIDSSRYQETILIVEDHEALRYYLRKTFESNYRVVDVADAQEAILYLSYEYPDLILSDVMMPGIQGDDLCRLVKENPNTSGIPFILLTAKVNHEATVEGIRKGADDYISKPFSTEILKLKVLNLIENRKRQRDFFMQKAIKQVELAGNALTNNDESIDTMELLDNQIDQEDISSLSEVDQEFVTQASQIVIENVSDINFSIDTLCQEMAMSRTLFYSRLKSLTGKAPQEFIRIIKLQKAAELLKEGKNVSEAAADTGFVNAKYFSTLFKKHFGVQPSKYK